MNPAAWIHEECYPPGFQWADPSKIQVADVFDLFQHWRERKEVGLSPLIWKPSCELLADVVQESRHVRNQSRGRDDSYSDGDNGEENYAKELDNIPEHDPESPPPSPALYPTQRGPSASHTEDIGEAGIGSPPFQAPLSVQHHSCKPCLSFLLCLASYPTYMLHSVLG